MNKRPSKKQQQSTSPKAVVEKSGTNSMEKKTMTDLNLIEYDTDLNEAEAPVPLPEGDYPAEIRSVERKTSHGGNDYLAVTFHIAPEAYPADYTEGSEDGISLVFRGVSPDVTQRARWNMKKFCEAIGAALGKKLDVNDWLGLSAIVTVAHDTYEGETRAQIKKVNQA